MSLPPVTEPLTESDASTFQSEPLFPVPKAVELVTGQRPSPATCSRWRQRGVGGVKLATVRVGGRRMASTEAVRNFIEATTRATDGGDRLVPQSRTNRQRESAILRAEAELNAAGCH